MPDYYVSDFLTEVIKSGCDMTKTKMYVLQQGEHHTELVGGRIKQNGGAFIFTPDEVSEHHDREREGHYSNIVHERRNTVE